MKIRVVFVVLFILIVSTSFLIYTKSFEEDVSTEHKVAYVVDPIKEYEKWSGVLDTKGSREAYLLFKEFFMELSSVQHNMSHIFGELLYNKNGALGVAVCDDTFSFGCYHGFFTAAISDVGLEIIPSLDEACAGSTACQHGIGHGILEYMRYDLENALHACSLTDQPDPVAGCTSGVFMEYNVPLIVDGDRIIVEARVLNKDNPYEPCTGVSEEFRSSCYHELGQWWGQVYDRDYMTMGSLCSVIEDEIFRKSCFTGIGKLLPNFSDYDLGSVVEICEQMPTKEGVRYCKYTASGAFLDNKENAFKAPLVCDGMVEEYKENCVQKDDLGLLLSG